MWSEEEFTIFQMKLVELGQENFQLKEQIATVKKENADFDNLSAELQKLEQQRDESRERHEQSVAVLREEFTKLQKEQKEQEEEALKRANERVSELTRALAEVNQDIKTKEEAADVLKAKIKKHDGELQQKTQYLHQRFISNCHFWHVLARREHLKEDVNLWTGWIHSESSEKKPRVRGNC